MTVNGAIFDLRTLTLQGGITIPRTYNAAGGGGISLSVGIYNESNQSQTFNVPIGVDDDNVDFAATNGNLNFFQNFDLNNNTAIFDGAENTFISGQIQGAGGSVIKNGSGLLIFANSSNNYTGPTTINGGTLRIGNDGDDGVLPTAVTNDGTLEFRRSNNYTYGSVISGSGQVVKGANGLLTLTAANTYSGATTVNAGTLRIDNANALGTTAGGTTVNDGAALELNATANYPAENLTLNGTGISDGGALIKNNTGNRNYLGNITLESDARINVVQAGLIHRDANLDLGSHTLYIGGNQNFIMGPNIVVQNADKTDDNGAIFKDGSGWLEIRPQTSMTGNIILQEGVIRHVVNSNYPTSGLLIIRAGQYRSDGTADRTVQKPTRIEGNFEIGHGGGGSITFEGDMDLNGGVRQLTMANSNIISGSVSNGGLTKTGPGSLTLSGTNTYEDDTSIEAGDLTANSAGAFGGGTDVFISNGATLTVSSSTSAASVREAGFEDGGTIILETGNVLTVNGADKGQFFQNSIGGAGGLTMAGTGTTNMSLYGTQSYTGPTTVSGAQLTSPVAMSTGSLAVSGGLFLATAADILGDNIPVTVNGGTYEMQGNEEIGSLEGTGGTVQLNENELTTGGNDGTTTFAGVITGTGSLTKTGSGAFRLNGNNTFTGLTTVNSGQLRLGGTAGVNTITGDILVDGGSLDYANADNNQINNASSLTIDAGTADFGVRTETIGALNMSGGELIKGNNNLTISSVSALTGGKIETTSNNSSIRFNNDLTLGDATIEHSGTNGEATNALRASGNIFVNAGTTPEFVLASGADPARINLNNAIRTIDVDDAATLTMNFILWGSTNSATGIIKEGPGTLLLNAENLYTNTTTLRGGTLEIGADERIDNGSGFVFDGGTFSTGGFNETVGTLDLQDDSEIALGTGSHTLTFDPSSSVSWDGTATLTITGWTGDEGESGTAGRIFVGSAAGALTSEQLNQIEFDGYGLAMQLSTGEIVPRKPELTVTVPGTLLFPFAVPQGNPSAEQSFTVEAQFLSGEPTVTAPTGYEAALNAGGPYSPSLQIPLSDVIGTVNPTDIYVRLIGTAQGEFNGLVTVTESTVPTEEVIVRGAVLTPDTEFIGFDEDADWTAGSGGIGSFQTDHVYADQDWIFTGGPALRQITTEQDGFPGALDTYAWRLRDVAGTEWTATFEEAGTVTSFGFKVRRWDDSPDPNWEVSYSTDAGASFTPLETINNTYLFGASQWRVFNYVLGTPVFVPEGNLIVRLTRNGGERIMIDDFFYDIELVPCENPDWHYRSVADGNWINPAVWEHSENGTGTWTTPTCGPTADAASITVRDEVEVNTVVSLTNTVVESGAKILYTGGVMEIFDGPGDDLVIEDGGIWEFDGANIPLYDDNNVRIRVASGGIIRVNQSRTAISSNLAGNGSQDRIIYEDGAVFEWNNSSPFNTSGEVYFPDADQTTIPVFRTTVNTNNVGGSNPTVINGLYEANGNTQWVNNGNKVFRNGIIGSGNVSIGSGGIFVSINGNTSVLGGTGSFTSGGNGIIIGSNTTCTLISHKEMNGGRIDLRGTLDMQSFTISGNHSQLRLGTAVFTGAQVLTSNPNGLVGAGAAFSNTSATYNIDPSSVVEYYRPGDQTVTSFTDYGNLILSGSGNKTLDGDFTIESSLTIREDAVIRATSETTVFHRRNLTLQDNGAFHPDCFDHLRIETIGTENQTYTGTAAEPIRLLSFSTNKTVNFTPFNLTAGVTNLKVKDDFTVSYGGGSSFRDNGNLIEVGGNVILDGGTSAIQLTGTLEMTGAGSGTEQSVESTPDEVITTHINNLTLSGTKTVRFAPSSGAATIRINGDVDIQDGVLNPQNNTLDLRGNWSNYGEEGFAEGSGIVEFRGSNNTQTVTCPGGERFAKIRVNKTGTGDLVLNHNLEITGGGTDMIEIGQNNEIDLNGNGLLLNGGAGDLRLLGGGGTALFKGSPGSFVEIGGGAGADKSVVTTGAELAFDENVTLRLRRGLDFAAGGVTVMRDGSVLEIASGGFVNVSGPLYEDFSTLRYATGGNFNRGIEWENMTTNVRYPYRVEVDGTDLNLGGGSDVRGIRGDLLIFGDGTVSMNDMSNDLEVLGDVVIGGTDAEDDGGILTLSTSEGGDLRVGGDLIRHADNGTFNQNFREVMMIGDGNEQNIFNIASFDFLAVANDSGSVVLNNPVTIGQRLRLTDGLLNVGSHEVVMDSLSLILRQAESATMSNSPVVSGAGHRYNIQYEFEDFATDHEWSPVDTLVNNVTLQGAITTTMGGDRAFNGSLLLNGADLNLGGQVLTARGRNPLAEEYSGEVVINWVGTRNIDGPGRFDIIGLGETGANFRTKRFRENDGGNLVFGPDVEVRIGNGGCDFGAGNPVTVQGVLAVRGGGYVLDHAVNYAENSVLRFANGFDYEVNLGDLTWSAGDINSEEPGIPYNVEVTGTAADTTELFMNSPRTLRNNLNIEDGWFTLTDSSGTFALGGNWTRSGGLSQFNHNRQEVIFRGAGAQTIATPVGVGEVFYRLSFDSTGTKTLNEDVTVLRDLEIRSSGAVVGTDKNITVRGSWINSAGPSSFNAGTSTVILENDTMANRIISPNGADTFYNLHVNNLDTGLVIHDDIRIAEEMRFINGVVIPEEDTEEIVFLEDASWSDAGSQSFAAGWVRSIGFDGSNFREYPVGYLNTEDSVQVYMPAGIRAETGSATAAYRIRYFHENYNDAWNTAPQQEPPTALPLTEVSTCNWWDIERVSGTIGVEVQLTYDIGSDCYDLADAQTLTVSRFDGSNWVAGSSADVTGDLVSGNVRGGIFNAFSPFTVGSTGGGNALPITLLHFDAYAVNDETVVCEWATASEINNDYFTVERSADGNTWTEAGRVQGAGNSNSALHYSFADDAPYTGVSYYRLRQTDFDGTTEVFDPRAVQIGQPGFGLHRVFRTESALDFVYSATAPYLTVEIFDMSGRLLHGTVIDHYGGKSRESLQVNLARGVYLLRLSDGVRTESKRFFY